MNIQIFGKSKCFDTKKAERYFKERGIKYQYIDMQKIGMSKGEFSSVKAAVGLINLIDEKSDHAAILNYLAYEADKEEKVFENQNLIRTPVVRNGRKATVSFCPQVWSEWV